MRASAADDEAMARAKAEYEEKIKDPQVRAQVEGMQKMMQSPQVQQQMQDQMKQFQSKEFQDKIEKTVDLVSRTATFIPGACCIFEENCGCG